MSDFFGGSSAPKRGFLGISPDSWQTISDILGGAANLYDVNGISPALFAQQQQMYRQKQRQQAALSSQIDRMAPQPQDLSVGASPPGSVIGNFQQPGGFSQAQADFTRALPVEAQASILKSKLFPEGFSGVLGEGQAGYVNNQKVAEGPPKPIAPPKVESFFDKSGREFKAEFQPDGSWKPVGGPKIEQREPRVTWTRITSQQDPTLPPGGVYERSSDGQTRAVLPPTKEYGPGRMKLAQAESEAQGLLGALNTFQKTVDKSTTADFANAAMGGGTSAGGRKLKTDWTNAALMAKGEALFNLGVLSGDDLTQIRNALVDPSTQSGFWASREAYKNSIEGVKTIINQRLAAKRASFGGEGQGGNETPALEDPLGIR